VPFRISASGIEKIDKRGFCVQEIYGYCVSRCRQGD
jgi:hypothetical protein